MLTQIRGFPQLHDNCQYVFKFMKVLTENVSTLI